MIGDFEITKIWSRKHNSKLNYLCVVQVFQVKIGRLFKFMVKQSENSETFPKVLPSFRQDTSPNCIC